MFGTENQRILCVQRNAQTQLDSKKRLRYWACVLRYSEFRLPLMQSLRYPMEQQDDLVQVGTLKIIPKC